MHCLIIFGMDAHSAPPSPAASPIPSSSYIAHLLALQFQLRRLQLKTASALPTNKDALVKFTLRQGGSEAIVDGSDAGFESDHGPVSDRLSHSDSNGSGTKVSAGQWRHWKI